VIKPARAGPPASVRNTARWLFPLACGVLLALLVLLAFVTAPGDIIGDTKLNLAVNPSGFLARTLTLWDPQQFGELQNQVVGYLFPMGPFFVLGKLAAMPAWIIQRTWISAVLVAAFAGTIMLASRMGIGTQWTRLLAGLAYALSPLALGMLGEQSAGFLPMAMLPWIMLPLVTAAATQGASPVKGAGASPARYAMFAARSAVAVALCGGVNATSVAGAVAPAVIYLLTRPAGIRWRLVAWWTPAVLLATAWWSVPLVLLSKYGVSPLPYTESAATTTAVTSLSDVLRGTSDWVGYLEVDGAAWWPQAFRVSTSVLPTVATGVIAGLGLAGLIRRGPPGSSQRIPERPFLLSCVLAGVVIIAAGYVSSLGNPLAGPLGTLINGPLSALRNLWKFDPMIRLPVALGLAHLLATQPRIRLSSAYLTAGAGAAIAALAIAALAVPAYLSGLAAPGAFPRIPSYWVQAADWLNSHAGHQGVLLEPGAPFGQYVWGSTLDDVLSPLTSTDYAERDLSDIGSPGEQRLLTTIDQWIGAGQGSRGLTQTLARMGIRYVVVRNDLNRAVLAGAWPARVNQALNDSPGMSRVAQFGLEIGDPVPNDAATNFDPPYPAVEIYQVAGALPVATVQPAAGTLRVYGGPEALLTLASENLLGSRPVLINDDGAGLPASGSVVTDTLRRRVRNFGELRTSYSPTLTATQPADTPEAAEDYTEPGWDKFQSVAQYIGIADVTASSSASDIEAIPAEWASGLQPFAAVDGDMRTMWESGSWTGPQGQWIQVTFDSPVNPGTIHVAFDNDSVIGPAVTQVRISTAAGQVTDPVAGTDAAQPLRVPAGPSSWLRITATGFAAWASPDLAGTQLGIYDIAVPGVQAARTIVAPSVPGDPAAVVLTKAEPPPSGCMLTSLRWVCSPDLISPTEEQYGFDQSFTSNISERTVLRGSAILTDTSLVESYVRGKGQQPVVTASSSYTPDPQDQGLSAFDTNPATTWVASPDDENPVLSVNWGYSRRISQVRIQRPPGVTGTLQVLITGSKGQLRAGVVGASGVVRFAPMRTTSLRFTFTTIQPPLQISEVTIPGVSPVRTPAGSVSLPCGQGPVIEVNGTAVPTRAAGSYTALLTGQPLQFTACAPVTVAAGTNRVTEPASDAFSVQDVVLGEVAADPSAAPQAAGIVQWTASARTLRVSAPVSSYLVVNENFDAGWQAVIDGRPLQPVRLDGWKQAWLLPAGTTGLVHLTYQPQALYRAAVLGGLAALGLLALFALLTFFVLLATGPQWPRRHLFTRQRVANQDNHGQLLTGTGEKRARKDSRVRRLAWQAAPGVAVVALAVGGLWLGGYPGVVILPAVTLLFLVCAGDDLPAVVTRRPGVVRVAGELSRARVLAGLLVVAAACGAISESLEQAGNTGLTATALAGPVPQIICLVVIGRLAAALILS
jgi:arabinofuranan 3-O-arabinosyltransferase